MPSIGDSIPAAVVARAEQRSMAEKVAALNARFALQPARRSNGSLATTASERRKLRRKVEAENATRRAQRIAELSAIDTDEVSR